MICKAYITITFELLEKPRAIQARASHGSSSLRLQDAPSCLPVLFRYTLRVSLLLSVVPLAPPYSYLSSYNISVRMETAAHNQKPKTFIHTAD